MTPPYNFSWVNKNLAAMACPQTNSNLEFLITQKIQHLITLSPEMLPPTHNFSLEWTQIPIEEFQAPTLENIDKFLEICQRCEEKNQIIGVHCRMGRGRTGVMLACYLMFFKNTSPHQAVTQIRLMRPGSIETPQQERAVLLYYDKMRQN